MASLKRKTTTDDSLQSLYSDIKRIKTLSRAREDCVSDLKNKGPKKIRRYSFVLNKDDSLLGRGESGSDHSIDEHLISSQQESKTNKDLDVIISSGEAGTKLTVSNFPTVFDVPFRIMLAGPSGSGKTTFITRLLKNRDTMFDTPMSNIYWFYNNESSVKDIKKEFTDIKFYHSLPSDTMINSWATNEQKLIILDDLMMEMGSKKNFDKIFTRGSHHSKVNIIYTVQNIFPKSQAMRTISLQCTHIVLFKNSRDVDPAMKLGRQIVGSGQPNNLFLKAVFKEMETNHYGYITIITTTNRDKCTQWRYNIFPDDTNVLYIPKEQVNECKDKLTEKGVQILKSEALD